MRSLGIPSIYLEEAIAFDQFANRLEVIWRAFLLLGFQYERVQIRLEDREEIENQVKIK